MTQTAKITPMPAFNKRKELVEEVVFKSIPDVVKKKVVVVYNHFNIEAILAAAILKQCYGYFKIVTIAQNIPSDGELYVWVGVCPQQVDLKELMGDKEHMTYSTHDKKEADEFERRPSIVDQICQDFMVRATERIMKISFLASRFFLTSKQEMNLEHLAYIYNEMKNAVAVLHNVSRRPLTEVEMVNEYMKDVKMIQAQFTDSYKHVSVAENGRYRNVIYTAFSDHNFVLALRLMKLSNSNFVNHTHGLNGQLVYSSLSRPELGGDYDKIILLN